MDTFVHMHDGEAVYYEDACYVCESQQIERDNMIQVPGIIECHERLCGCNDIPPEYADHHLPEIAEPAPYHRRHEFSWYDLRNLCLTLILIGAVYGIWTLAFILLSLLLHGTVKW